LTKRHIVNVNFSNITTATQLKNLFFNEKLTVCVVLTKWTKLCFTPRSSQVYTDSTLTNFDVLTIPIEHRIYILEEIDAIGNIVRQRDPTQPVAEIHPDELTLAEILTVLDGTLEAPGRIVIMTSNHPDVLDKALVRPGRIDVSVKFGFAQRELIQEMYHSFFGRSFSSDVVDKVPDKKLSAAEVSQILFRHFKNPDEHVVLEDFLKASRQVVVPPPPMVVKQNPIENFLREVPRSELDSRRNWDDDGDDGDFARF